ncbi:MAG: hypothetical protein LBB10_03325 [Bifidobacteriaceae bacterium]|jgi:hypothetical protein|nr:hypothetical protein [Bifidobacteriaceae bacterium]
MVRNYLFLGFVLVFLTSCSMLPKQNSSQSKRVLNSVTYESALPSDFDGLYADKFANIIKNDPNDFVYSIIKDSKITEQGFSLVQNAFKMCINNGGYKVRFANDTFLQGAYLIEAANPKDGSVTDAVEHMTENCKSKTGYIYISMLYYQMLVNPLRQDFSDYIAKCLVKFKYESEGYTGQDYLRENGTGVTLASGFGTSDTQIGDDDEIVYTNGKRVSGFNYLKCQNDPKAALSEK